MIEGLSTDDLLPRLKPYLAAARQTGGDVLNEVGTELTSKAVGSLTGLGFRALGAVQRAIRNRFHHARAKKQLDLDLDASRSDADRESAYPAISLNKALIVVGMSQS